MAWNPLKDVKKVVKKVYDPVEDLTKGSLRGTRDVVESVYNPLEKGVSEVGKRLEKVGQETGKGLETAGREVGKGIENVGQEIDRAWNEQGLKEAVIGAGLVAGAIYTGGALAGVAGVTTASGAAMTGATALGSAAALTAVGTAAVQGQQAGRAEFKQAQAQKEYNRLVEKANKEALEERKSSLLKTKKQLVPNLTKSSQGGFGGGVEDIEIKLG